MSKSDFEKRIDADIAAKKEQLARLERERANLSDLNFNPYLDLQYKDNDVLDSFLLDLSFAVASEQEISNVNYLAKTNLLFNVPIQLN